MRPLGIFKGKLLWTWCHVPAIPASRRVRREGCEFEASLEHTAEIRKLGLDERACNLKRMNKPGN